jgi:acyl-CoA synthetase (AMP-forming)/AMP-acid ligase II
VIPRCREALATYKVPKQVVVHAEPLPRNANGKVLKRALRPWALEQLTPLAEPLGPSAPGA